MTLKNYLYEDYWNIGIIDKPIEQVLTDPGFFSHIHVVETPGYYYLADPFWMPGLEDDTFLCEKFFLDHQVGIIASVTLERNTDLEIQEVITAHTHFSFPFVFQEGRKKYVLPENSENGKLMLFELDDQKKNTVLLNEPVVDPVLFKKDNTWFLFCSILDDTENEQTHLYFAESLTGPWTRHPQSPICKTKTGARMAGSLFRINSRLYRPGQDCSTEYGGGICLFQVVELSTTRYIEKLVKKITPPGDSIGIHTINRFGKKTIVDLKSKRLSLMKSFWRLKRKIN
jgi:hypothetical protein